MTTTRLWIDQSTSACSMSVVVRLAAELLRKEYLCSLIYDVLAGRDAGRQEPAVSFPPEDLDLPTLVPAGADPHVDQSPPLMVEECRLRHRDGRLGLTIHSLQIRCNEQPRAPYAAADNLRSRPVFRARVLP